MTVGAGHGALELSCRRDYDAIMRSFVVTENRRARFDYEIEDTYEAGIELSGTEVKSLRNRAVQLKDSYGKILHGEVFLVACHISPYFAGNRSNHEPERPRRLLLKKREIRHLIGKVTERGFTLIPLKIYFNDRGRAKVLLGLGKGKAKYDKRKTIKERDEKRDLERDLHG
jgi:SsrA-binding protein